MGLFKPKGAAQTQPSAASAKLPKTKPTPTTPGGGGGNGGNTGGDKHLGCAGGVMSKFVPRSHAYKNLDGDHGYRYMTEFVGTFFLALVGMQSGTFTTALILMALTSMGANESQAHFNPAVTIAYLFSPIGNIDISDAAWCLAMPHTPHSPLLYALCTH